MSRAGILTIVVIVAVGAVVWFGMQGLTEVQCKVCLTYNGETRCQTGQGSDRVFSGHDVRALDDLLSFEFYALNAQDGDRDTICNAMRQIADFVHAPMSTVPPGVFPAYSAGVYQGVPDPAALSEAGIAGLTGDGGVYCDSSN